MNKIFSIIKEPWRIISTPKLHSIMKLLPDNFFLKAKFKTEMGKSLNLITPCSFNEKLQWLKLNNRQQEYTKMVDKYAVKDYVADIIGEEYIIPTLGVWDTFDEINFNDLPESFVLKCTHDSAGLVIVKDKNKLNINQAREKINKCLRRNYYYNGREWPYKNVKPRIIAEKYMEDPNTRTLKDYKFFTFNGVAKIWYIASGKNNPNDVIHLDFFDMDYNHLKIKNGHPFSQKIPDKPQNFDTMRILAEKLSVGIPHVRVDFYEVDGNVYFGEMTFFHNSGFVPFEPEYWDEILGSWIYFTNEDTKNG